MAFGCTPDFDAIFQRVCGIVIPLLAIMYLFFALTMYLHNVWTNDSIYVMFLSCCAGELILGNLLGGGHLGKLEEDRTVANSLGSLEFITRPLVTLGKNYINL